MLGISQVLSYKDLVINLVSRDFKTRYKRSYLGILWSLFNPLLLILVYTLAFDYIMKIRVKDFPMFFMCGYLPWSYFSSSLMISLSSLSDSGYLIKAVYFPREIVPLSIVLSCLLHFLITFIFVFPILLIYGYLPQWSYLLSSGHHPPSDRLYLRHEPFSQLHPRLFQGSPVYPGCHFDGLVLADPHCLSGLPDSGKVSFPLSS